MFDPSTYQRLEAAIRELEATSASFKQTIEAATVEAKAHAKTCTDMAANAKASAEEAGRQRSLSQADAQKTAADRSETYTHSVACAQSEEACLQYKNQTVQESGIAVSAARTATAQAGIASNAADSATLDAATATKAAEEAKAAAAVATTGSVPYPDVWLPFNDDLELVAGFGEFDQTPISVSGGTIFLQLKSKSAIFTRATASEYVNKSGQTVPVAPNIPCFMAAGLRMSSGEEVSIEQINNDCVEFYNGKELLPVEKRSGRIYFKPTTSHLRNVRGFMRALTAQEKKFL